MTSIKEYRIVDAMTTLDLSRKVNDLIFDGWEPVGGLVVIPNNYCCQATIRRYELF